MIKKAISIAVLFLVTFVIAIGIAKANPTSTQPFNSDPRFSDPGRPGSEPATPFVATPQMRPGATAQIPKPTCQQPNEYPDAAQSPSMMPGSSDPSGPQFSESTPARPEGDNLPFAPGGQFMTPGSPV